MVADAWTPLILRELFLGRGRFDDLVDTLGVGRATLARRLKHLEGEGIVERVPYRRRPVRHEYRLTEPGQDLFDVVVVLLEWGRRWKAPAPLDDEDEAPVSDWGTTHLVDPRSGRDIDVILVERRTRDAVLPDRFELRRR